MVLTSSCHSVALTSTADCEACCNDCVLIVWSGVWCFRVRVCGQTALPYTRANAGFAHSFQLVNVADYNGIGESTPQPYFYQNLGEAEYVVAVYQYMRLLGYPASSISILTTYNGQKSLIEDIITTVRGRIDRFQKMCG